MAQAVNTLHKDSCGCGKSELDLFSVPPTQIEMNKGFWESVDPVASVQNSDTIEFICPANPDVYTDLANSYLHVKAKITKANGTNLEPDEQVGPVNLWLHALFSQVEVFLNNKLVTPSSTTYPYRAYMESILNFSKDAKLSQLTSALFYKDKAGKMDSVNPVANADAVNTGLQERYNHSKESKMVSMEGKIHSDLFAQDRYILGGIPIKLKLVRSSATFSLVSSTDPAAYKVVIEDCVFRVRKVNVSPTVMIGHTEALKHTTAKYPINRVECKVFSTPRGNYSGNQPNIFQGQLPDRIVIGMVDSTAFNGSFKKNPFNFKNYDITYLALTVNGEHLPSKPLQLKFGDEQGANYVAAFQTLYAGSNKLFLNEGNGISRDEYPKGYTLFVFNLTADLCARDHLQPIKSGNISLEVQFGTALTSAINIVVLGEFESLIEIDANRNVLCDFNS